MRLDQRTVGLDRHGRHDRTHADGAEQRHVVRRGNADRSDEGNVTDANGVATVSSAIEGQTISAAAARAAAINDGTARPNMRAKLSAEVVRRIELIEPEAGRRHLLARDVEEPRLNVVCAAAVVPFP